MNLQQAKATNSRPYLTMFPITEMLLLAQMQAKTTATSASRCHNLNIFISSSFTSEKGGRDRPIRAPRSAMYLHSSHGKWCL
jgi:hypothetical protein